MNRAAVLQIVGIVLGICAGFTVNITVGLLVAAVLILGFGIWEELS